MLRENLVTPRTLCHLVKSVSRDWHSHLNLMKKLLGEVKSGNTVISHPVRFPNHVSVNGVLDAPVVCSH